jgi:cytoskeletal protein RodZ
MTGAVAGEKTDTGSRTLEHATRLPTIAQLHHRHEKCPMTLILLEALGAGLLLVLIVWWTMFSGRDQGEPRRDTTKDITPEETALPASSTTAPSGREEEASGAPGRPGR